MKYKAVLLFLFLQSFTILSAQSGWTKDAKSYFLKLDFSNLKANKYSNPLGEQLTTSFFSQQSINFYGEYGLTKDFTIISNIPLLRINSFETTEKVAGFGDVRLDLKYRLPIKLPVSFSLGAELPTGQSNKYAYSKTFPTDFINLPIGDGELNIWSTLATSMSVKKVYFSLYGAYNYRTTYNSLKFVDLYQIGAEFGYNPLKDLWLNVKLKGQFSTKESTEPSLGFLRGDGTTYTIVSAEAFYKLNDKFGISATFLSGGSWLAPLKNLYTAPYFSIGLVYEKK
jgi:hypothetical protein